MKLFINVAYVLKYSPETFKQSNTVSRKKTLFAAITVIFQLVYLLRRPKERLVKMQHMFQKEKKISLS